MVMRALIVFAWLVALAGCRGDVEGSGAVSADAGETPAPQFGSADVGGTPPRQLSSAAAPGEDAQVPDLGTRQQGVDWPRFLGPTGDSKSPETGILQRWPRQGPPIVWQREIHGGYGIGTVSRGRYFQMDRIGDRAILDCVNSQTGEHLWSFDYASDYADIFGYDGGPRCSPVIDGDRVYIFGSEGILHCLRVTDGEPIWKVDTQRQYGVVQNFFGVGSTPIVEGDLLIVQIGGSPPESQNVPPGRLDRVAGNGTCVVAFHKYTGEEKYRLSDELASYAAPVAATIDSRRWCFVFARGGLLGFAPTSGKLDFFYSWRASDLESVNASTPVVVGNEVFISETYGPGSSLLRVREGGYEIVWRDANPQAARGRRTLHSMQTHWNTPIHHEGYLYGSSGRHSSDAELRCIEWSTGKVLWSEPGLTRCSLLYADGHFICLGEDGALRLIKANPQRYERVSEVILLAEEDARDAADRFGFGRQPLLKYPAWAAPILSHGLMYVRGRDRVVCLELIPEDA